MKLKNKLFSQEFTILFPDLYLLFIIIFLLSSINIFSLSILFSFKKNTYNNINKVEFSFVNYKFKFDNQKKNSLILLNNNYNTLFYISNLWNYTFGPTDNLDASPSIYKNGKYYYLSESYYKTENNQFIAKEEYISDSNNNDVLINAQGALFNYNTSFNKYFKTKSKLDYIYVNPYIFKKANLTENETVYVNVNNLLYLFKVKKLINYENFSFILPIDICYNNLDDACYINFCLLDLKKYSAFCNELSKISSQKISNQAFDNIIKITNITTVFLIILSIIILFLFCFILPKISFKIIENRKKNIALRFLFGQKKHLILLDIILLQMTAIIYSNICTIIFLYIFTGLFKTMVLNSFKIFYTFNNIYLIVFIVFLVILVINFFINFFILSRFNKKRLLYIYRG